MYKNQQYFRRYYTVGVLLIRGKSHLLPCLLQAPAARTERGKQISLRDPNPDPDFTPLEYTFG